MSSHLFPSLRSPRVLGAAALLGTVPVLASACGGPSASSDRCQYQGWQGQCELLQVGVSQIVERFPRSFAVYQAVYRPIPNLDRPNSTPPDTVREFTVDARFGDQLQDHLQAHAPASCRAEAAGGPTCEGLRVTVTLPEFVPGELADVDQVEGGCAGVDATAGQDVAGAPAIPERFDFAQGSPDPGQAGDGLAQSLVARFKANPAIECLAVIGSVTGGEAMPLADARARKVRGLLIAAGIPAAKVMPIGAGTRVFGQGETPPQRPEERQVRVRVLRMAK